MKVPEFTQNKDSSVLLFFNADNTDIKALCDELEKTYVCYSKMQQTVKDGKKYVVLEIDDENG